jgi:UDP-N-acetylglucosamine 4,6-dehydratase/5-epimerase
LLIDALLELEPAVIRVLDINETALFNLRQKYRNNDTRLRFLLGDIRSLNRLLHAFRGIDIVFHTASYKHVLECEHNPVDAVENNINGTINVVNAAIERGVQKVIFTSSDKAANPSNTMGVTKLLAEKLMIAANTYSAHSCIFACCRFGNVVRANGSVIPLFEEQIRNGKKITITDPEMTRFIIPPEKAVELVLRAGYMARCGEVFVYKMPSIKLADLVETMMSKYAKVPTEIIGKKAGEKMYEELMTEEETSRTYENDEMYIIFSQIVGRELSNYKGFQKVVQVGNSRDANLLTRPEIMRLLE